MECNHIRSHYQLPGFDRTRRTRALTADEKGQANRNNSNVPETPEVCRVESLAGIPVFTNCKGCE